MKQRTRKSQKIFWQTSTNTTSHTRAKCCITCKHAFRSSLVLGFVSEEQAVCARQLPIASNTTQCRLQTEKISLLSSSSSVSIVNSKIVALLLMHALSGLGVGTLFFFNKSLSGELELYKQSYAVRSLTYMRKVSPPHWNASLGTTSEQSLQANSRQSAPSPRYYALTLAHIHATSSDKAPPYKPRTIRYLNTEDKNVLPLLYACVFRWYYVFSLFVVHFAFIFVFCVSFTLPLLVLTYAEEQQQEQANLENKPEPHGVEGAGT